MIRFFVASTIAASSTRSDPKFLKELDEQEKHGILDIDPCPAGCNRSLFWRCCATTSSGRYGIRWTLITIALRSLALAGLGFGDSKAEDGGRRRAALVHKPEWPAAPLKKSEQRALDIASADRAIAQDASRSPLRATGTDHANAVDVSLVLKAPRMGRNRTGSRPRLLRSFRHPA